MNVLKSGLRMRGKFRLEVRDGETGELTRKPMEFPNLILDQGLNQIGVQYYRTYDYCQVGSSNVAPNVLQTSLVSRVATAVRVEAYPRVPAVPPDYVMTLRSRYRFNVGVAAGNLSEIGTAWGTGVNDLFSRALIVDEEGEPTTITILPTEILDVFWDLELYPSLEDSTYVVNIGGVDRTITQRWALAATWTNEGIYNGFLGWDMGRGTYLYTSAIGPITGDPPGPELPDGFRYPTILAYSANSNYRDLQSTWAPGAATGTIRSALMANTVARVQIEFDPPISKGPLQQLVLTFRTTWARYVP